MILLWISVARGCRVATTQPVADWSQQQQPFVGALMGGSGMMAVGWELLDRDGGAPASSLSQNLN